MPLIIYIYCILLTISAIYGIHILKPKLNYMLGAALFVLFCWFVCIDYYLPSQQIFASQITLAIYAFCAICWQAIELKAVKAYMQAQNSEDMAAMQQEFDQDKNLMPLLTGILFTLAFFFYFPILYMGFDVFMSISN